MKLIFLIRALSDEAYSFRSKRAGHTFLINISPASPWHKSIFAYTEATLDPGDNIIGWYFYRYKKL